MTWVVDIVVPTIGRSSLPLLLDSLAAQTEPVRGRVLLVDDRRHADGPLLDRPTPAALEVVQLQGPAAGPAAARNVGWRAASPTNRWVAFLDDDVVADRDWWARLQHDLDEAEADPAVGGVQGTIHVPRPAGRPSTDWERNVAGLETARWATADMAYRRDVLAAVGGFDEVFPRAYREDADLALRVLAAGATLRRGTRGVTHPVRPAPWHASIRLQAGNADDATMRRRHGPGWRERAGVPRGAFRRHVGVTAAAAVTVVLAVAGRRRAALAAAAGWALGTGTFARRRITGGPRTAREVASMVVTSVAIPPAAVWHRLAGELRALRHPPAGIATPAIRAVLFDRDGTLVVDVPYNGDPGRVAPVEGARAAVEELRAAGLRVGIVSNQSGVSRGLLDADDVAAVNGRVEELLGPFDVVAWCPHGPGDGCGCRKPRPGLVQRAAGALGVDPSACVVIGDIGADVDAALAAGARAVLVPTPVTLAEEVDAARRQPGGRVAVETDLASACQRVLTDWCAPDDAYTYVRAHQSGVGT